MNDFQKVCRIATFVANAAAETNQYRKWDDQFSRKNIDDDFERLKKTDKYFVNVTNLTSEECNILHFGKWDEESGLRMVPLYLYPFLEYGQELTCINGSKKIVNKGYNDISKENEYIDNDHRGGSLAYGFVPKS